MLHNNINRTSGRALQLNSNNDSPHPTTPTPQCARGLQGQYRNLLAKATEMSSPVFWLLLPTLVKTVLTGAASIQIPLFPPAATNQLFCFRSPLGCIVGSNDLRLGNDTVFFLRKCIPIWKSKGRTNTSLESSWRARLVLRNGRAHH